MNTAYKRLIFILILIITAGSLYLNIRRDELKVCNGKVLNISALPIKIQSPDYQDQFVKIRLVKAEGKYIAAFDVISPDVIIYYEHGKNTYWDTPGSFFDEIGEKYLNTPKLHIYKKAGCFYKNSIRSLQFGNIQEVKEFSTTNLAHQALMQQKYKKAPR